MDPILWVMIVLIALLVGAAAAWFLLQQRRRTHLREHFGPEYDRAVSESGDRVRAERELEEREQRVRKLDIRPLSARQRDAFAASWRDVQARFVDTPSQAIHEADELVSEVMRQRGYPVGDFEQRAADVSVDHPRVVENYREARVISLRNRTGDAGTEELRQAMVHYRALFEDLLETPDERNVEVRIERAS